jgi:glycosyltransferase involved in cell wall biosynthesis
VNEVLLTVSGVIDPEIEEKTARGERPQADYMAMSRAFGADLLDYAAARRQSGVFGGLLEKIGGPNLLLAWVCWRLAQSYRVIFTDGEQVGIPLAFLLKFLRRWRHPRHLMIAHILSVPKKSLLLDLFRLASHIHTFIVYSTWQKTYIQTRWKVPEERVIFTPFMVDTIFFTPLDQANPQAFTEWTERARPLICSVGLEFRDYPTLMEAVRDLDVDVVIAAASPWSRREDTTAGREIPANVKVRRYTQYELRELYQDSAFMVMPLYKVNFQAGVTALLEAMAMEKAVICTSTPGQTDVVEEGYNGLYTPPGDVRAMREKIARLLEDSALADRLGKNGRKFVLEAASLDCYLERLLPYVSG